MYREYWKLKRLHNLNSIYEELGDKGTRDFLNLYRLVKKEGTTTEQVVRILHLANEQNASGFSCLEKRSKWIIDEIRILEKDIERDKNYLYTLNKEIAGAKYSLDYCHDAYEHIRQELQRLYEEKSKIESLLRENNGNIAE